MFPPLTFPQILSYVCVFMSDTRSGLYAVAAVRSAVSAAGAQITAMDKLPREELQAQPPGTTADPFASISAGLLRHGGTKRPAVGRQGSQYGNKRTNTGGGGGGGAKPGGGDVSPTTLFAPSSPSPSSCNLLRCHLPTLISPLFLHPSPRGNNDYVNLTCARYSIRACVWRRRIAGSCPTASTSTTWPTPRRSSSWRTSSAPWAKSQVRSLLTLCVC
eukprot:COSAG05_NODE_4705_length_1404_cov_0.967050_2_plen_217_part_00